jgi:adenylate cyclase class 2
MQNIEFKSELRDIEAARAQCRSLGAERIGVLEQTDQYFRLTDGRLKRREAPGEPIEWIYYHRPQHVRPRMCNYSILTEEQAHRRWGTASLKTWIIVRKSRELWMLDNVRIHLDEVAELGRFLEFEAIVSQEHDVKACHEAIDRLRDAFRPVLGEPIGVGYVDLLAQEQTADPSAS